MADHIESFAIVKLNVVYLKSIKSNPIEFVYALCRAIDAGSVYGVLDNDNRQRKAHENLIIAGAEIIELRSCGVND